MRAKSSGGNERNVKKSCGEKVNSYYFYHYIERIFSITCVRNNEDKTLRLPKTLKESKANNTIVLFVECSHQNSLLDGDKGQLKWI